MEKLFLMQPTLVILAAGIGSRYGGLKQLDGVGPHNETIIDYSVYDAIRAGFGKIVFVIRHDIQKDFVNILGNKYSGHIPVDYAFQELNNLPDGFQTPADRIKPWGTGHAILMTANIINEPFAVINSDDFYGSGSFNAMAEYLRQDQPDISSKYAMVGFKLANTLSEHGSVARGICAIEKNGCLKSLTETLGIRAENGCIMSDAGTLSGDQIVSMNMWGFHPSLFEHLEEQFKTFLTSDINNAKSEFYIPTVINNLINSGQTEVKVLETDSSWFGVTYREDKPRVAQSIKTLVAQQIYPSPLW